jgi:hypothetical protein
MDQSKINNLWSMLGINKRLATKEVAQNRYDICKSCDRFANITKQCLECKCFMKVKVTFPKSVCPIGKW